MRHEHSYGIVPLQKRSNGWHVFMVCHKSGHWSLPKGHPEAGETPLTSATRELFEETGLCMYALLSDEPFTERYRFTSKGILIDKQVDYFVAEVIGEVVIQVAEVTEGAWLSFENALDRATYPEMKSLLNKVRKMLPT